MGRLRSSRPPARSRQEGPQQQQPPQDDAPTAALIAAAIIAPTPPTVGPIATLLLPTLPAVVLAVPALAADVAEAAATVALAELPRLEAGTPMGPLETRARFENVLVRGFYAVNVARRLARAVTGPSELTTAQRLEAAVLAERPNLAAHKAARAQNLEASRRLDRAVEVYGEILGWRHGVNPGAPKDPRSAHSRANGKNFRPASGPPVSVGALPGTLKFCTCEGGAPFAGAEVLR